MFNYDQKQTFVSIISHCPPSKSRSTSIWNLSYVSPSPFFEISVTSCYAEWCLRWVLISYVLTSVDRFGTHTASHYQRRDGASSIDHTDLPPCFDFSTTIARTFHVPNSAYPPCLGDGIPASVRKISEKHTLSDRIYRYRSGHWKSQPLNAKERRFTKALEKSTAPIECRRKAFYQSIREINRASWFL